MSYLVEEKGSCSTQKYIMSKDAKGNRIDSVIVKSPVQLD